MSTEIPPLFPQQEETVEFMRDKSRIFDMSDPGTGKTRSHLQAFVDRLNRGGGRAIVLAPKSILQAAWGNDIDRFFPGLRYSVAYAQNRESAFRTPADIYITNHDAIKWLAAKDNPLPDSFWNSVDTFIVDESTCYKHHTSQRSKAAKQVCKRFEYRELMTGTPNPNGVTDLWHQALILDDGERLGTSFWRFRNAVQEAEPTGPGGRYMNWKDKEGAEEAVYDQLRDITIRHELTGIPGNHEYEIYVNLAPKLRKQYNEMVNSAITVTKEGKVLTAVHAASLHKKLLQMASGAAYTGVGDEFVALDDGRADLVMDLVEAREWPCVVVFEWRHQRKRLVELAEKRKIRYAYIDGGVAKTQDRTKIVQDFQDGKLDVIFVHPQSAGHGLTLTRGRSTIFMSPTYNAEHYKQVFHRIVRAGQEHETETIHILANDTLEPVVYGKLGGKLDSMSLLLHLAEYKEKK